MIAADHATSTAGTGLTYVSLDVENLVYGIDAVTDAHRIEFILDTVLPKITGPWVGDATVVNRRLAASLALSTPPQLRVRRVAFAPDAADLDLIERLDRAVPPRVDHVVIASGDQRFIPPAQRLRARGLAVTCLALRRHIHHGFWQAGIPVVELDAPKCSHARVLVP